MPDSRAAVDRFAKRGQSRAAGLDLGRQRSQGDRGPRVPRKQRVWYPFDKKYALGTIDEFRSSGDLERDNILSATLAAGVSSTGVKRLAKLIDQRRWALPGPPSARDLQP